MAWGTFDPDANVTSGPNDWDTIYFAGVACPGIAKVSVRLANEIDDRRQVEVKKSFVVDKGSKPVRVTVDVQLLPDQLAAFFVDIIPLIAPRNKSASQIPLAVTHPALMFWSVNMLIVEDISQAPLNPRSGTLDITISLVEYEPAPKSLKKSAAKTEKTTGATTEPVNPKPEGDIDKLF